MLGLVRLLLLSPFLLQQLLQFQALQMRFVLLLAICLRGFLLPIFSESLLALRSFQQLAPLLFQGGLGGCLLLVGILQLVL